MALVFNSKNFLTEIITDFQALLAFMDKKFGKKYAYGLLYEADVSHVVKETLTLEGTMIYYFILLTKRAYPTGTPTSEDIKYINAVWDGLGYPEKKLVT
jgi:hypothetical protein